MNDESTVTPILSDDDIFTSEPRAELARTPVSEANYTMQLQDSSRIPLRVKKTATGNLKAEVFFTHTGENASKYKGVTFGATISGINSAGRANVKQFADLMTAIGYEKSVAAMVANGISAAFDRKDGTLATDGNGLQLQGSLSALDESDGWKGVDARIVINGDAQNLAGRTASVKTQANQKDTKTVGKSVYRA